MSYFRVTTPPDTLALYAWADNPQHALRKVEELVGALPPQRVKSLAIEADGVPEGCDVIDEPEMEREARTDGQEV
jgi:hypothetical protein